jgi:NADH-quinone oxidoreductase subunit L
MRKMGGLSRKIPWTYATMLIGSLAIAGIPPLAGFFSKDEILGAAFKAGGDASGFYIVWAVGFLVAGMTAFYMFRLMGLTFWGESRVDPEVEQHIHEAPWSMRGPLVVLAIASIGIGFALGYPPENGPIHHWLAPIFEGPLAVLGHHEAPYAFFGLDGALALASVLVALVGIAYAWRFFGVDLGPFRFAPQRERVARIVRSSPEWTFLYRASVNKWWFDDINDLLFVRFGGIVVEALRWFDVHVIDGAVNGVAALTRSTGGRIARVQTGHVQNYAFGIALGLVLMAVGFLVAAPR